MIVQTQFPLEGVASTGNKVVKGLVIGIITAIVLAGLYFTVKAFQNTSNEKQVQPLA